MILTVNIGNTHITIGGYEKDCLKFCGRLHSDIACTADEYAIRLVNLLSLYHVSPAQIEGGILGSVVPALTGQVLAGLRMLCSARILTVGPGLKSCIKLRLDNPAQLGAELLCGVVAALAECPGPLAVISADTAISNMGVGTDVLTEFVILVACWQLPKKFPKEFQSSMFHMDERLFKVILACIGVIMLGTSYVNLSDLTPINYLCLAVYLVALFIFTQVRYKHVVAKRESLVR